MNFLIKLFNKFTQDKGTHPSKIQALLDENKFIDNKINENFYEDLKKLIIGPLNNDTTDYYRFKEEFNIAFSYLKEYLDDLLKSKLSEESLNTFYNKHLETLNKKYQFPGTNGILSSYWFQIIRKIYSETQDSNDIFLKQRFEVYFHKLRESSTNAMQAKR